MVETMEKNFLKFCRKKRERGKKFLIRNWSVVFEVNTCCIRSIKSKQSWEVYIFSGLFLMLIKLTFSHISVK